MHADPNVRRGLFGLVPLQLVILAMGVRYIVASDGIPKLIGWTLVVASLITLVGYGLAIWRTR